MTTMARRDVQRTSSAPAPAAQASPPWSRRCLLGLQDLEAGDIRALLQRARAHHQTTPPPSPAPLAGQTVATLFFEDSTRTRSSFTIAARRLGAEVLDLAARVSSVSKGETAVDTALNIEAMGVGVIVVRHPAAGAAHMIAAAVRCAVVNAGDGRHEHPTQGLLDLYALAEATGRLDSLDFSGLTVAIVGDLANSRVARSAIAGLTKLGADVVCVGPPGLAPAGLASLGAAVSHDVDEVLPRVDAAIVLRLQLERGAAVASVREYAELYQLNEARAARMKPGAVVMHPGPMNRGVEIASAVADGERSLILKQVANGVPVRMAVMELCAGAVA